jgi:hypothetical protein
MKSKYNINDSVEHPKTKSRLIIKDLELIDNEYVYYFEDYLCFPESVLNPYFSSMLGRFFNKIGEFSDENMKKRKENLLRAVEDEFKDFS